MFVTRQKKKKNEKFISFAEHLKQQQQSELRKLKSIKSNFIPQTKVHTVSGQQGQMCHYSEQNSNNKNTSQKQLAQKDDSKIDEKNWLKLDDRAYIVNNRLLIIQDPQPLQYLYNKQQHINQPGHKLDTDSGQQYNTQLLQLLKINKIPLSKFIYGNRNQILQQIRSNQQNKDNQQIIRYINKNMRNEKQIEIVLSSWYQQSNRNALFEDNN